MTIEKNKQYEVEIIDLGESGEGIGKINDFTIFVKGGLIGDRVKVELTKIKKNYGFAKCLEIIKPSPYRCTSKCDENTKCGGCQLQNIEYEYQLQWKQKKVENCLKRIGKLENIEVEPILGMENPYAYRNKAQYPIREVNGKVEVGFFAPKSHTLIPIKNCCIQHHNNKTIINLIKNYMTEYKISAYNEQTGRGLVRHLVIKTAYQSQDIMVILVSNGRKIPHVDALIKSLQTVPQIKSIILNHYEEGTGATLGNQNEVLFGDKTLLDTIGPLKFNISPLAFFQVNPIQTEKLYKKALEFASLNKEEIVWDAYCGIGTLSLFLAQKAKKVYGVEVVADAVQDAKQNAILNEMTNVEFIEGKAEDVIPEFYNKGISATTLVVDPPRKGCDTKLLQTIKEMSPQKVVYVSCDPATLARDLAYLTMEAGYKVNKVQPVDMFPQTMHVETVCCLQRVNM